MRGPTVARVADAIFEERRLVEIYDALDSDRRDLEPYVGMIEEFQVHSVLDLGCGTGTFACLLSERGIAVTAVDPAAASLAVARGKAGAARVRWVHGDATSLPPLQVDLATMTANVAQVFLTDQEWDATLRGVRDALRPAGRLVFETRDPSKKAWLEWNREQSYRRTAIADVGIVETWVELLDVDGEFVSFRQTFVFASDAAVLTSDSTLRFRPSEGIADSLLTAGFRVDEVRDAPDRPGREFVFITTWLS